MDQISCGGKLQMWGVDSDGNMWILEGQTRSNPRGSGWTQLQQTTNNDCNVGVGQTNEVWKVTRDGSIYRRQGVNSNNWHGNSWSEIDGKLKQVSVGNWDTWGVTKFNEVVRRTAVSIDNPTGDSWEQVPGSMMYIAAAEEGMAWAIDLDHEVWIYMHGEISWDQTENEKHWNEIDQGFIWVDVGRFGRVVAITVEGEAWYRTGITQSNRAGTGWVDMPLADHEFSKVAIGDDGFIYAESRTDGRTYFRT